MSLRLNSKNETKTRDLNSSYTLGSEGRYSKTRRWSSGHAGDTRPGQTRKKLKDLSTCDREERERGEGGGVYTVYIRERGVGGRGG